MQAIRPEMVLGKQAVAAGGNRLGAIVDVGVHDMRRVKFLVVQTASRPRALTRLDVDLIDRIDPGEVKIRAG